MSAVRHELCRHEALRWLAERSPLAFSAATIRRRLNVEFDFTSQEVEAALAFLVSFEHVSARPDDLGSTLYFQATASGVLAHERNP
ncbi:MAG: hypothetical protein QM796_18410 [Chthoniobacteraceae bacterium]